MKVLHIITGLSVGGAERSIYRLIQSGLDNELEHEVVCLSGQGRFGKEIEKLGVKVHYLLLTKSLSSLYKLKKLKKIIDVSSPDIIQGWMYHGNLLASFAHILFFGRARLFWNVRHNLDALTQETLSTKILIWMGKKLSPFPEHVIYNSNNARIQHEKYGFDDAKSIVIPNGIVRGKPLSPKECAQLKAELGLTTDNIVIGHVARYHPLKDHASFLKACVQVLNEFKDAVVVCVGRDVTVQNDHLMNLIPMELRERFRFLGERGDVEKLYYIMDVFCLSSVSEAFPNVILEAMAARLPVVSTTVGDCLSIVGNTGIFVEIGNYESLGKGLSEMLLLSKENRNKRGLAAQERVKTNYSLEAYCERYRELYTFSQSNQIT
jgi:glycosyltransferase involved in cell wall biosynthesis